MRSSSAASCATTTSGLWAEHRELAAGLELTRCLPADVPGDDRSSCAPPGATTIVGRYARGLLHADVNIGAWHRIFTGRSWSGGWWRPTVAETLDLLDACVHCGFCLPACPTYNLWGDEMDSPRGRIHLMRLVELGEIELDATVAGALRPLPRLPGMRARVSRAACATTC